MMQGDAAYFGIRIFNNAGSAVTPQDLADLEITIGHLSKSYRRAQLLYENGLWLFPMTQTESFSFWAGAAPGQVRLLWHNGVVEGVPLYGCRVTESLSREVL